MEAATDLGFAIDEGLDAEADALDAALNKGLQRVVGDLAGSTFDVDLGCGIEAEFGVHGSKQLPNQVGTEQAGRTAAEVDGINAAREMNGHLRGPGGSSAQVFDDAGDIALVIFGWKHT